VILCELLVTILDPMAPLPIQDPSRTPFGQPQPEKEHRPPHLLDTRTQNVRKVLRGAMIDRFYCRYHPIRAFRNSRLIYGVQGVGDSLTPVVLVTKVDAANLHHSYLMDMQVMLYPSLQNGALLQKMVYVLPIEDHEVPNGWTVEHIVAKQRPNAVQQSDNSNEEPPAKRPKTLDRLSVLLNRAPNEQKEANTPETVAKGEIDKFRGMEAQVHPNEFCTWWGSQHQFDVMPALSQVALALFANKVSSGGLECDIGSMNDMIAPKRSTLRAGLIEVNMFLKLNSNLYRCMDPSEVTNLDCKWESMIPTRPVLALYDEDEEEPPEIDENLTSNALGVE
jgi:hypothetical protein